MMVALRLRRWPLALHAGYWLAYVALLVVALTVLSARLGPAPAAGVAALTRSVFLALTLPYAVAFYGTWILAFPLLRHGRSWWGAVARGAVVCGAAAMLSVAILWAGAGAPRLGGIHVPLLLLWLVLLVGAGLHAVLAIGMRGFLDWLRELREREAREREKHALELALLRSRLDPHFLFNTLNNIDVLIERDPALASEYLHRLSALMRYVLFESSAPRVPLAAELEHMTRYMELESLRHADASFARLQVEGDPDGFSVPPTAFMPFVENAFKHGIRDGAGQIDVRVAIREGELSFTCRNRCSPAISVSRATGGLGLTLARRRLELLYPGRVSLDAGRHGDEYRVDLTIRTGDDR